MGKFLKPGKVVLVLSGRFAGRKAVIVKTFDDGNKIRKFAHALVVGIDRYPRRVTRAMSKEKVLKRTKVKPFVKFINLQHVMPTRYSVDIDLKTDFNTADMKTVEKKVEAKKKLKKVLEERYLGGCKVGSGSEFFFQKLRF